MTTNLSMKRYNYEISCTKVLVRVQNLFSREVISQALFCGCSGTTCRIYARICIKKYITHINNTYLLLTHSARAKLVFYRVLFDSSFSHTWPPLSTYPINYGWSMCLNNKSNWRLNYTPIHAPMLQKTLLMRSNEVSTPTPLLAYSQETQH